MTTSSAAGPSKGSAERLACDASRSLRLGYLAALALVAGLTVGSHGVIASMLATNSRDATTINSAGRQRMLSQRISKEAVLQATELGARSGMDQLRGDLTAFRDVHQGLRFGSELLQIAGPGAEIAGPAFHALDPSYEAFYDAASRTLRELEGDRPPLALADLLEQEAEFLPRMDNLVSAYQRWSDGKLATASRLHLVAGSLLLLVIMLEAWFLFRPAIQRIRRQMLELAIAQERTQLLATAAEHTRHAVLLGEADGSIVWINPAAEDNFRNCESDLPTLADATPLRVAGQVRAAIEAGDDLHIDDVRSGGSSFAIDLVAVRDGWGKARRYVLVVTDLSERARRERDLQGVHRRAGRADVAVSVLHNVGNTLNSLALAAAAADSELRESRLPGLAKALGLLPEDPDEAAMAMAKDPKIRKLPEYLHKLTRHLEGERKRLREELGAVHSGVEHLRHVVSAENATTAMTASDRDAARENLEVGALVAEAVRVYGSSVRCEGIEIDVSQAQDVFELRVDRHEVLQILGNLLTNAVRAIRDAPLRGVHPPRIHLVTGRCSPARGYIEVIDEGVGVAPEHLGQLFKVGFSTKPGSQGIGLEASANAATAMSGSLTARSEGLGRGATFRLELALALDDDQPRELNRRAA